MPKIKNPRNDDHYDGNDEQIEDLKGALNTVVAAARNVIENWSQGDLAGAVNQLESAIEPHEGDAYEEKPVPVASVKTKANRTRLQELREDRDGFVMGCPSGKEIPDPAGWAREDPKEAAELERLEGAAPRRAQGPGRKQAITLG
jgi:hypothetical protein